MIAGSHRLVRGIVALYPIFLTLAVWEAVARLGLAPPLFLPAFSTVVRQIGALLAGGEVFGLLGTSLIRAGGGFALALVVGVALGFLMARVGAIRWLLDPLVAIGFPAPKIAFIPIFILWFGIGDEAKIALVAFNTVFPFILAAYAGARTVPVQQVWAARSMGDSELGMLWRVVFPAALPSLMSGVRIGVPIALLTTFTAEMVSGGGGLGGGEVMAERYFELPTVYGYLTIMLIVGYALDTGMIWLRKKILRWHEEA